MLNAGIEAIPAPVEVLEELSPQEERERHRLELRVERAFYEAGVALRELRDKKLYRSTHRTFEAYCRDRFNYSRDTAYLKIAAAVVYENIQKFLPTNCRQIPMPMNEYQLRAIAKAELEPEIQASTWLQGVEEAGGKPPSGRLVKSIVERIKEKPVHLASDYCKEGEVFFLQRLAGVEKKYNGCWAIAIEVESRFTVKAAVYDGILELRQENMKPIDSEQSQTEIREIYERLKRLMECQLDPIDEAQIEVLCRRPSFTSRQKQALSAMEGVYGIEPS